MLASAAQTLGALLLVLGLIFGLAWATRRMQNLRGANPASLSIESGLTVGTREKILLVRAEGERLLVGVTPQGITLLHRFGPSESFQQHLAP